MPDWNPDQYLKFADERTQPCRDLVARIATTPVRRVIDLGCGPGNSTAILTTRWPDAEITGLDGSAEMIEAARRDFPEQQWMIGDITTWAEQSDETFDVVFSNAALQWVPDHATLYPKLYARVAPGGAFAVQVPLNFDATAHRLMRELASSAPWRDLFPAEGVREWHVHTATQYYDMLTPYATRIDLWETEYIHVLPSAEAIVEWYKGSGLRPFLGALANNSDRERFAKDFLGLIRAAFTPQADGKILFPFLRLFLIAYR